MKFFTLLFCLGISWVVYSGADMTQEKAVALVRQLPEVQKYLKKVPNAHIEMDHETDSQSAWVVHVFEIKNGHTATLNWFEVDKKTGKIQKEFH